MTTERNKETNYTAVYCVVLMLVLYILSVGPVSYIDKHWPSSEPLIRKVYAPLIWLCERGPFVEKSLDQYAELWAG